MISVSRTRVGSLFDTIGMRYPLLIAGYSSSSSSNSLGKPNIYRERDIDHLPFLLESNRNRLIDCNRLDGEIVKNSSAEPTDK